MPLTTTTSSALLKWMYSDIDIRSVKRAIVFGAGSGSDETISYLKDKNIRILSICDNDMNKVGKPHGQLTVESPAEIHRYGKDTPVFISSSFFRQIFDQLTNDLGFSNIFWGKKLLPEAVVNIMDKQDKVFHVTPHYAESDKKAWATYLPKLDTEFLGFTTQPTSKPVFFSHGIPKTGSRSFQEIVRKSCSDKVSFIKLNHDGVNDMYGNPIPKGNELIVFSDNLHSIISAAGFYPKCLTILRDPVDRLVSDFYYRFSHVNRPDIYIEDDKRGEAFEAFVESAAHLNYYSRIFSGNLERDQVDVYSFVPKLYNGGNTEKDFESSLSNLEKQFFFVGIFEEFEKTMFSVFDHMGWRQIIPIKTHYHKTLTRPKKDDLSPRIKRMIEEKTVWDRRLYDILRERFSINHNKDYGVDLVEFKKENRKKGL